MGLASVGLVACDDDDEEATDPAAATSAPVTGADAAGGAGAAVAPVPVAGEWNGVFDSDEGQGHLDLELIQMGDAVAGQFFLSNGEAGRWARRRGL